MQPHGKDRDAERVIQACLGRNGIWASPYRYAHQCWTRDFVLAAEPYLAMVGSQDIIDRHLGELIRRQRRNGRVPVLYLDDTLAWLRTKVATTIRHRRMSFMLRHYLTHGSIELFSPWTKDSEILLAIAYGKRINCTLAEDPDAIVSLSVFPGMRALEYVEAHRMRVDGFTYGADWRDTRLDLGDKALLTNNCLLAYAYELWESERRRYAERLRDRIRRQFWTGTHYRDYLGVDHFDTLGNALAILHGIATPDQYDAILAQAERLRTPYGLTLNTVILPPKDERKAAIMARTPQQGIIWPFIHGYAILALLHSGRIDQAREEFAKWDRLSGFWEFYDPLTGHGGGSEDQLWSACLYLRCAKALEHAV